jgi:hypothetical protein
MYVLVPVSMESIYPALNAVVVPMPMLVLRAHPKRLAGYTRRHESLMGPNLLDNITLVGKGQEARGSIFQEHSLVMDERASNKEGQYEDL